MLVRATTRSAGSKFTRAQMYLLLAVRATTRSAGSKFSCCLTYCNQTTFQVFKCQKTQLRSCSLVHITMFSQFNNVLCGVFISVVNNTAMGTSPLGFACQFFVDIVAIGTLF